MLFHPKNSKYTKFQKGKLLNCFRNNINLKTKSTKSIKLIALEYGRMTSQQLVALRGQIRKSIKKIGFLQFHVCPQLAITKKPSEIRMGKGKGSFSHWVLNSTSGMLICEVYFKKDFINRIFALMQKVQKQLPIKTKIVFL
jgi:large subunit ribosomal protein L16